MPKGKLYIKTDYYSTWESVSPAPRGRWIVKTYATRSAMPSTGNSYTTYIVKDYNGTGTEQGKYSVYLWKNGAYSFVPAPYGGAPRGEVKAGVTQVWVDAYERYGISLDETALSKLMTPPPNKEIVENKSDLENGKRVVRDSSDVRKDERNVSIIVNIHADSQNEFLDKYGMFCEEVLDKGFIDFYTPHYPHRVFRMTYLDCTQFSEYDTRIGKYTLSMNEPDPTNRNPTDKNS